MAATAVAKPDLKLGADRQDDRKHPIQGHWVRHEPTHAHEQREHSLTVHLRNAPGIGRSADSAARQDQPAGRPKIHPGADDAEGCGP